MCGVLILALMILLKFRLKDDGWTKPISVMRYCYVKIDMIETGNKELDSGWLTIIGTEKS